MSVYKKNIILLVILMACFMLTIAYGYGFRNFIRQPKLPAQYSPYKSLDRTQSSRYKVEKLVIPSKFDVKFDAPVFIGNHIVLNATAFNSNESFDKYYKLDTKGNLIDSLDYSNKEHEILFKNGFLLHKDYYRSWAIDGDTARHKYIEVNANLKLDSTQMISQFFNLNSQATASHFIEYNWLWEHDDPKRKLKIDKVLLLINNKWIAYYGANLYTYRIQSDDENKIAVNLDGTQTIGKPDNNFEVVYFYKTSRLLTDKNEWFGDGFINLKMTDDTVKFKYNIRYQENKKSYSYSDIKLFNQPNGKVKFLGIGQTDLYVIKPKSK